MQASDAFGSVRRLIKPEYLQSLKQHLIEHRTDMRLFNNAQFARQLEAAFEQMWEQALQVKALDAFEAFDIRETIK